MSADSELVDLLAYLREAGATVLAVRDLAEDDRTIIDRARAELMMDGQILRTVAAALQAAEHGEYRISCLTKLIEAVIDVASRSIITEPTWKYVKETAGKAQAEAAREARRAKKAESPREKAIQEEIDTATATWNGKQSSKLAVVIAQSLATKHNIKISDRAIYDRLENWKFLKSFTNENGSP